MQKVTKAIIPAAGFGTRFLPATKSQPKEMLPVVDKPTIQYIVEEAVESGIEDILIVIGRYKSSIEDHFDRSVELEMELEAKGKYDMLEQIQDIAGMANIQFVDNVSYIQAFRQLSIPLGAAAGIVLLHEKITKPKLAGLILIVIGLILVAKF